MSFELLLIEYKTGSVTVERVGCTAMYLLNKNKLVAKYNERIIASLFDTLVVFLEMI